MLWRVLCCRANWRMRVLKLKKCCAEEQGSVHSSAADAPPGAVDMLKLLWGHLVPRAGESQHCWMPGMTDSRLSAILTPTSSVSFSSPVCEGCDLLLFPLVSFCLSLVRQRAGQCFTQRGRGKTGSQPIPYCINTKSPEQSVFP